MSKQRLSLSCVHLEPLIVQGKRNATTHWLIFFPVIYTNRKWKKSILRLKNGLDLHATDTTLNLFAPKYFLLFTWHFPFLCSALFTSTATLLTPHCCHLAITVLLHRTVLHKCILIWLCSIPAPLGCSNLLYKNKLKSLVNSGTALLGYAHTFPFSKSDILDFQLYTADEVFPK